MDSTGGSSTAPCPLDLPGTWRPAIGRNLGVDHAHGEVIIFIDSIWWWCRLFAAPLASLRQAWQRDGNRLCFTYGAVINTHNFESPESEPHKLSDLSWAYFATGNVAIDKTVLQESGLFDPSFQLYGWEDLELGEGFAAWACVWCDALRPPGITGIPAQLGAGSELVRKERERAKMGLVFTESTPPAGCASSFNSPFGTGCSGSCSPWVAC